MQRRDPRVVELQEEHRPRRARARRARAQRHGAVLRREPRRLRGDAERLGAVLRLALHAPVDPVGRRLAPGADHGATGRRTRSRSPRSRSRACSPARSRSSRGRSCATTSRSATPPTRSRSRCATRSPTSRRPASASSRSTSPRCASCCRSRRPTRPLPRLVGRTRSASPPPGVRDADADPHPPLLLGVRRGHRRDRRPRRRRHVDRGGALAAWRSSPTSQTQRLRPRHRPGRLRHPLAARAERRRGDRAARAPRVARDPRPPALGQPRLRPEDPRLRRDRRVAAQPGHGHQDGPRRTAGSRQ